MSEFISTFFDTFSALKFGANTYVLMWVMTVLIIFNVFLAIKKDSRFEKLSKIISTLGWFGFLYCTMAAIYTVGNPAIEQPAKLFFLFSLTLYGLHPVLYALFGKLLVQIVGFFTQKDA